MRRAMVAALAAMAMMVSAVAWGAEITPTVLRGGPGDQITGEANTRWTIWSSNSTRARTSYQAWAKKTGKPRFKVNDGRTKGFYGSLDGDTTEAIFQQTSGGGRLGQPKAKSSIYLYDLADRDRSSPGARVNTKKWEWAPSVSPGYILFGRSDFRTRDSLWKILLYNRSAKTFTLLDSAKNKCRCIFPGQVTDTYATWTKCSRSLCQSYYYTIGTLTTAMIPNPLDEQTYYPAVAATSGNLYFARSDTGCGAGTQILRWDPIVAGAPVVVSSLPIGRDLSASSLAYYDAGGHDDVFLSVLHCGGRFVSDVDKIEDADTASFARGAATAQVSAPRAAKHLLPPGAVPVG